MLTVNTTIPAIQTKVETVQRLIVTMTVDRLYMLTVNTTTPAFQQRLIVTMTVGRYTC